MPSDEQIQSIIEEIVYQVHDNYNGEPGYTYEDYARIVIKNLEEVYEWILDEDFALEDVYGAMDDYDWIY